MARLLAKRLTCIQEMVSELFLQQGQEELNHAYRAARAKLYRFHLENNMKPSGPLRIKIVLEQEVEDE